MTEVYRQNW